jgi:hypothetical protein
LPELASSRTFEVRWSAEDRSGAGIAGFDVQVRQDNGDWQDWLTGTTATHATFTGHDGARYAFRVRARDGQGNIEPWRDAPDAETALLGLLDGSVRDIFDNAVAGARVCLADGECVETDQAGSFQFTARPPGVYELTAYEDDTVTRRQGDKVTHNPPVTLSPPHLVTMSSVRVALGEPRPVLVRLLPARNRVPNGDFSGPATPNQRIEFDAEGNRQAVLHLGRSSQRSQRLSYVIYVAPEMIHPVLAFDYMLTGAGDLFTAGVVRDLDNGFTPLVTRSRATEGWQHRWFDLTPYRGRYIEVGFAIYRQDRPGWLTAFLDNVVVADAGSFQLHFPHVAREGLPVKRKP